MTRTEWLKVAVDVVGGRGDVSNVIRVLDDRIKLVVRWTEPGS